MTETDLKDEEEANALTRNRRKEDGKKLKRQRIENSGGVRPRDDPFKTPLSKVKHDDSTKRENRNQTAKKISTNRQVEPDPNHRFGRVMDVPPSSGKPRFSTVSIALPGSIVGNAQTRELKTHLVGQIARSATIYHIDEIVVFDDKLSDRSKGRNGFYHNNNRRPSPAQASNNAEPVLPAAAEKQDDNAKRENAHSDPHAFMSRLLQYCECPQYLRRHFFPMHPDLTFAGVLAPVDAPHHVRAEDRCKYRDGVVLEKVGPNGRSLVNCGIRNRPVEIDARLQAGIRCTVQLNPAAYGQPGQLKGKVVSPSAPREEDGTYWGYTVRPASSIQSALDDCPFDGGYDLKIGTSERGNTAIESKSYKVPKFKHALIVFGGVAGIEECVDADESIRLAGAMSHQLFDQWVNICPFQGSRTIRTEVRYSILMYFLYFAACLPTLQFRL
jgi:predicted SPOUT superfamily RNA methylase MTH1